MPDSGDPRRARAEAFLRRIALTDADLPTGFGEPVVTFRDSAQLAGLLPRSATPGGTDEATIQARMERAGLVLAYEARFELPASAEHPGIGAARQIQHTGYAFTSADGPRSRAHLGAGESVALMAQSLVAAQGGNVRVEQVSDLRVGDETLAWRASGTPMSDPGAEVISWAIAVRRGAGAFLLQIQGTGAGTDRLARDLAGRLDQRLAAAHAAGAWP
jgi:hypothetical protein